MNAGDIVRDGGQVVGGGVDGAARADGAVQGWMVYVDGSGMMWTANTRMVPDTERTLVVANVAAPSSKYCRLLMLAGICKPLMATLTA